MLSYDICPVWDQCVLWAEKHLKLVCVCVWERERERERDACGGSRLVMEDEGCRGMCLLPLCPVICCLSSGPGKKTFELACFLLSEAGRLWVRRSGIGWEARRLCRTCTPSYLQHTDKNSEASEYSMETQMPYLRNSSFKAWSPTNTHLKLAF